MGGDYLHRSNYLRKWADLCTSCQTNRWACCYQTTRRATLSCSRLCRCIAMYEERAAMGNPRVDHHLLRQANRRRKSNRSTQNVSLTFARSMKVVMICLVKLNPMLSL